MINKKIIGVLVISLLLLQACKSELYSGLNEYDANNMLAILLDNDISAEKISNTKTNSYALNVDTSDHPQATKILRACGYPKEAVQSISELFSTDALVTSPFAERIRYIYASSQKIQETLTQIDGVLVSRVHVGVPNSESSGGSDVKPKSASVFIKYHPNYDLESRKSEIKLIVEKSIEGLSYDKVSVIMVPAQLNGC